MTLGTLRDQVIYPDSQIEMERKGITDAHLEEIMNKVNNSISRYSPIIKLNKYGVCIFLCLVTGSAVLHLREGGRLGFSSGLDGCAEWGREAENSCKLYLTGAC